MRNGANSGIGTVAIVRPTLDTHRTPHAPQRTRCVVSANTAVEVLLMTTNQDLTNRLRSDERHHCAVGSPVAADVGILLMPMWPANLTHRRRMSVHQ